MSVRKKYEHWLGVTTGLVTTVLKEDFVSSYNPDEGISDKVVFSGPYQLPTKIQVICLHLFLKDSVGRMNPHVKSATISRIVSEVVVHYWQAAGFEIVSSVVQRVKILLEEYQRCQKDRNKTSIHLTKVRKEFSKGLQGLFDVAHPDLEKRLQEDRIRANLEVRAEDIKFLQDQRGDRKMVMGSRDVQYEEKKALQLKRKQGPSQKIPQFSAGEISPAVDDSSSDSEPTEQVEEPTIGIVKKPRKDKKSEFVTVDLPRNLLSSLEVTTALDRTGTSNNAAMAIFSSILKTAQKDGQALDINELTLSTGTITRRRNNNREEISSRAKQEFLANIPTYLSLHWDGKMMADFNNKLQEMEAILVCGSPGYEEGKILGKCLKHLYYFISRERRQNQIKPSILSAATLLGRS